MTAKTKIAFVIPSLSTGGAEKMLLTAANYFAGKNYEVHIIFLKEQGAFLEMLSPEIKRWNIDNGSVYFSVFAVRKIVKQIKPNIFFPWMGYLNAYLAFFKPLLYKKMHWFCRESSIPSMMNSQYKFSFLYRFFYRFYNRYDSIVCQSDWMADDLIKGFAVNKEKIIVINNPVDFAAVAEKSRELLPPSPFDSAPHRLLYAGGLHPWKRPGLLIEALALLPEDYVLTILGQGMEEENIRKQVSEKGLNSRVRIIKGSVNPFPYYSASSCLILCSKFEGFPNVVTEAMATGCPAIGYGIKGGANEILTGYGGYIVEDGNMQGLVNTIREVCTDPSTDRKKISDVCRERYNLEKIMTQYEKLVG